MWNCEVNTNIAYSYITITVTQWGKIYSCYVKHMCNIEFCINLALSQKLMFQTDWCNITENKIHKLVQNQNKLYQGKSSTFCWIINYENWMERHSEHLNVNTCKKNVVTHFEIDQ